MKPRRPVVTFTVSVDADGNIWNDTLTHGSSFAAVYKAFHATRAEVDRQIAERRNCPYNPAYGKAALSEIEHGSSQGGDK